jgi:16S rRNA (cytidine1402-2'-O)-methyltransferase
VVRREPAKLLFLSSNLSATLKYLLRILLLYLVATPIGNLEDITIRALEVLKSSDLILCEDTRRSSILLKKYQITTPYQSFHKYSEQKKQTSIIKMLLDNQNIALISDAGTPLINDPGFDLVKVCRQHNIKVTTIPGPCSIIAALTLSTLETTPFQFVGFLPKKGNYLKKLLYYPGTTILFESPNRIQKTIEVIEKLDPIRELVIAREITKSFEDVIFGTPKELLTYLTKQTKLGEIILLIGRNEKYCIDTDDEIVIRAFQEYFGLSLKDAIKKAAKVLQTSKKELYAKKHLP